MNTERKQIRREIERGLRDTRREDGERVVRGW